jgi:hypothetical protein
VLTREVAHGGALGRWGLGSGRLEEHLVAAPKGSGRCTILTRRSLRWWRSASMGWRPRQVKKKAAGSAL